MTPPGTDRLSVCYLVPGSDYDPVAGPSRNAVGLAKGLAEWADVTLAFRHVPEGSEVEGVDLVEIDADAHPEHRAGDDSAIRGMGYGEFVTYLRTLHRFLDARLPDFDAVLEKTWLLSGHAADRARRRGVPAIPVENYVPVPGKGSTRGPVAYLRHAVGRYLAGRALRRAPAIIAETEYLKRAMNRAWGLPPESIHVIGVGIDRTRFRPLDRGEARRGLGIDADALVLLYVGILDKAHDLLPVIEAFAAHPPPGAELHLVGDGPAREECERLASRGPGAGRVRFHGTVEHDRVPTFIAASDLCLAPYRPSAFPGGEVAYSILKIREYLSAGRPVASTPSGAVPDLVADGETGFLFDNEASNWRTFLSSPPSRERLAKMGESAVHTELPTWSDVGASVYRVVEEAVGAVAGSAVG